MEENEEPGDIFTNTMKDDDTQTRKQYAQHRKRKSRQGQCHRRTTEKKKYI